LLSGARIGSVVVLLLVPLIEGCSHDYTALASKSADGGGCVVGNETCACYPNSTCQAGLTCASNLCVRVTSSGAGGSAGDTGSGGVIGSGGGVGTGGTLGTGGGVGTGGAIGTGGSIAPASNQIVNGDFPTTSTAPWGITVQSPAGTTLTGVVTNGQFCVSTPSYSVFTIGWPAAGSPVAVLQAGTTYVLSYQISTTATLFTFEVKVGQATPPYTQVDYTNTQDQPVPLAGLQTFTHTFKPAYGDSVAGLAFNVYVSAAATICLDNVALGTPN